jgi:sialate O-acetylesterase
MSDSNFRLPGYFATGMVIQQKVPLRVPGVCAPEREVSISLFRQPADGHIVTDLETQYGLIYEDKDRSDRYGRFNFKLPALEASLDPCTLILSCDDANLQIEDILVGEIWFAAGQDNMAMPVASCDLALRLDLTATMNHIRIFAMAEDGLDDNMPQYSYHPVGYIASGRWYRGSHPEEMAVISGIAYSFALRLEEQLLLPIGIYDMGCAGTYIHSWLPREIIEQDPYLKNHVRELHLYRDQDNWNSANPTKKKPGDQENSIVHEKRTVRRLTLKDNLEVPQSGNFQTRYQPATMFNHKLAPFIGLGVRGVLWYQGESDADSPDYYTRAFPVLVSILKEMFVAPENELRLIYSQIAAYCYPRADARTVVLFNEALSDLRRKLPVKAGMVTISDLPLTYNSRNETYRYPAHPVAKEAIGRRMASIALLNTVLTSWRLTPIMMPTIARARIASRSNLILSVADSVCCRFIVLTSDWERDHFSRQFSGGILPQESQHLLPLRN